MSNLVSAKDFFNGEKVQAKFQEIRTKGKRIYYLGFTSGKLERVSAKGRPEKRLHRRDDCRNAWPKY